MSSVFVSSALLVIGSCHEICGMKNSRRREIFSNNLTCDFLLFLQFFHNTEQHTSISLSHNWIHFGDDFSSQKKLKWGSTQSSAILWTICTVGNFVLKNIFLKIFRFQTWKKLTLACHFHFIFDAQKSQNCSKSPKKVQNWPKKLKKHEIRKKSQKSLQETNRYFLNNLKLHSRKCRSPNGKSRRKAPLSHFSRTYRSWEVSHARTPYLDFDDIMRARATKMAAIAGKSQML